MPRCRDNWGCHDKMQIEVATVMLVVQKHVLVSGGGDSFCRQAEEDLSEHSVRHSEPTMTSDVLPNA